MYDQQIHKDQWLTSDFSALESGTRPSQLNNYTNV